MDVVSVVALAVGFLALVVGVVALGFAIRTHRATNTVLTRTNTLLPQTQAAADRAGAAVKRLDELVARTEEATQAAAREARRTTARLLGLQVLALANEMMETHREVSEAVGALDPGRTNRGLYRWQVLAVRLQGTLNLLRVVDSEFIRRLQDVIVLAGIAADGVLAAGANIDEITREAR